MQTERINGYLYPIKGDHSTEIELGNQEEQLSAEEHLLAQGVPVSEIKKRIIDAE